MQEDFVECRLGALILSALSKCPSPHSKSNIATNVLASFSLNSKGIIARSDDMETCCP